jgi:hypothetical protein
MRKSTEAIASAMSASISPIGIDLQPAASGNATGVGTQRARHPKRDTIT